MPEQNTINAGPPGSRPWALLKLTLLGLLAAVIAAGVVFVTFEKEYEASTLLRISAQQPFLAYAPAESDDEAGERFVQTQIELIRSPLVLAPVVSRPEAAGVPELQAEDDPIQWVVENIEVSSVGGSELFKISLTCANPKDSAWLVNAVAHEYFLLLGQEGAQRSQELINTLRGERDNREMEVKRLRENLRELTRQVTGEDPFSPTATLNPNLDHPIADINSRLITAEMEQEVFQAKIKVLERELVEKRAMIEQQIEEQPDLVVAPGIIDQALSEHAGLQVVETLLLAKQSSLLELELRRELDKEDPRYQALRNEVQEDKQRLEQFRAEIRERIEESLALSQTAQLNRELAEMQSQLADFKSELEGQRIMEEVLRKRRDEKLSEAEVVGGDTLELHFLQGELTEAEGVLNVLSARILRLTTEQRAPAQVKLLQLATEAEAPVVEAPYCAMAAASTGGFCLPFLIFGLICLLGRSRPLEDPVFRGIWFDKPGLWRGGVSLPGEGVVVVAIASGRKGPTDVDRQTALELRRRYTDLKPSIANLLFDEYTTSQGEAPETCDEPGVHTLSQPGEIWDHACLEGFRIEKTPNSSMPYLRLVYKFEWDEYRLFFVYLWDWEVVRVQVDHG